jgi:hypothetical protein
MYKITYELGGYVNYHQWRIQVGVISTHNKNIRGMFGINW